MVSVRAVHSTSLTRQLGRLCSWLACISARQRDVGCGPPLPRHLAAGSVMGARSSTFTALFRVLLLLSYDTLFAFFSFTTFISQSSFHRFHFSLIDW
jgi:hypothetical protein